MMKHNNETRAGKTILIIKLGALGDVVRTTTLLRVLSGNIYWVTRRECFDLIPSDVCGITLVDIQVAKRQLAAITFDLVLSLDDNEEAVCLASQVSARDLIGAYIEPSGRLTYSATSAEWFDMSLISRYGKRTADALKYKNTCSYQEILFRMIGRTFQGEEYFINYKPREPGSVIIRVGIESRAGDRWPTKRWNKFDRIMPLLRDRSCEVELFHQHPTYEAFLRSIDACDLIITGDSLTLHFALALKKRIVAIFTCTSPTEIYSYGRMTKVISPRLEAAFYRTDYVQEAVDTISVDDVMTAVSEQIGR